METIINSLQQLQEFADALVRRLPPGVTIGLVGTLGAGKTSLTQAIARAVGIDTSEVTSPTFTLLQSHHGNLDGREVTLHHLDAYRISDEDEFWELGVDELFDDDQAWTIIEWADRVRNCLPTETLFLKITLLPDSEARRVTAWTDDKALLDAIDAVNDPQ